MNWEAVGTIGEIIGSLAVVISLIYVSVQIRHANKQSEIDAFRNTWENLNQLCDAFGASKETASIINRGRASLASLDADEYLIFEHIHLRLLNTLESWHLQVTQTSRPGDYQASQLTNLSGIASGYLGFPGTRELWDRLRDYFEPIADVVDEALSQARDSENRAP